MAGPLSFSRTRRRSEQETPTAGEYYESRARRISVFRWGVLLATVLFVIYGFLVHGSELTMDNFRYMLKFLSFTETTSDSAGALVHFDYAEDNQGALYKGDVVVLNGSGVSVYSKDAEKVFSFSFRMDNPRLETTADSIFAYDLGGSEIRIFNSYSQIARLSLDYPVYGFSASSAGFAVVTAEKNYRTAIYVYDRYARQTYKRLLSDTYADYVALREDGEAFAVLGHYSQGGYLVSFLQMYSVRQEDPLVSVSFTGEMPLKVCWMPDGRLLTMTGTALRLYDYGVPEAKTTLSLEGQSLEGCSVSHGYVLLTTTVTGLSGGSVLDVYDSGLQLLLSRRFDGTVERKTVVGDCLYVQTVGEMTEIRISDSESRTFPISQDAVCILENANGEPVLFEKSMAVLLDTYLAGLSASPAASGG